MVHSGHEFVSRIRNQHVGHILLKPDSWGNLPERDRIYKYLCGQISAHGRGKIISCIDFTFDHESALKFYPKDKIWQMKYGTLSLCTRGEHSGDAQKEGAEILVRMAEYLSSGPCLSVMFLTDDNAFEVARKIVGPTLPEEAFEKAPESLRGRYRYIDEFQIPETSRLATMESRAIRNTAHASDNWERVLEENEILLSIKNKRKFL